MLNSLLQMLEEIRIYTCMSKYLLTLHYLLYHPHSLYISSLQHQEVLRIFFCKSDHCEKNWTFWFKELTLIKLKKAPIFCKIKNGETNILKQVKLVKTRVRNSIKNKKVRKILTVDFWLMFRFQYTAAKL